MIFYLIFFILFSFNMIFFGILNIPLFKYFCDIPDLLFLENSNYYFFSKNYFKLTELNLKNNSYNIYSFFNFFSYLNLNYLNLNNYFYYFNFFTYEVSNYNFIMNYNFIEVNFQTSSSNFNFIEFCTLQEYIYVIPNETHLIFFRMYNSISFDITGISIYLLYPNDYLLYFNKIQCFCFEELFLYPFESIDLPVIFYISNDILNTLDFYYSNKLFLSYLFLMK